jgi:prepilin signal peptidase PulO-like enzyme (type II secretory pathway)
MNENIKSFIVGAIAFASSIISPIQDILFVLSMTFLFNIITGIVADIHVNKADFELKKAFSAFMQMALVMALVYYINGSFCQLDMQLYGDEINKWIALLAVYFYTTNILRNATLIYPKNLYFSFLYEVLTTKIFTRMKKALFMDIKGSKDND